MKKNEKSELLGITKPIDASCAQSSLVKMRTAFKGYFSCKMVSGEFSFWHGLWIARMSLVDRYPTLCTQAYQCQTYGGMALRESRSY